MRHCPGAGPDLGGEAILDETPNISPGSLVEIRALYGETVLQLRSASTG